MYAQLLQGDWDTDENLYKEATKNYINDSIKSTLKTLDSSKTGRKGRKVGD